MYKIHTKDYKMQISLNSNTVTITGNIKTINDFQDIKTNIDSLIAKENNITLVIADSLSITSSVIGYLNKIVLKDNIDLSMKISNPQLLELLADLNLVSVFKATKI